MSLLSRYRELTTKFLSTDISPANRAVEGREGEHRMMLATLAQSRKTLVNAVEFTAAVIAPIGFITVVTRAELSLPGILYVGFCAVMFVAVVALVGLLVVMAFEDRIIVLSKRDGATRRLTGEEIDAMYELRIWRLGSPDEN